MKDSDSDSERLQKLDSTLSALRSARSALEINNKELSLAVSRIETNNKELNSAVSRALLKIPHLKKKPGNKMEPTLKQRLGTVLRNSQTKYPSDWIAAAEACLYEISDWAKNTKNRNLLSARELRDEAGVTVEDRGSNEKSILLELTLDEVFFLESNLRDSHYGIEPGGKEEPIHRNLLHKVTDLYDEHCVETNPSPAMQAYNSKYGTYGTDSEEDEARWEVFNTAFQSAIQYLEG